MNFLKEGKTNWKYILIVVILATFVGGGVLYQWQALKEEAKISESETAEKVTEVSEGEREAVEDETADWKTLWGYEIKYPENFYLFNRICSGTEETTIITDASDVSENCGTEMAPEVFIKIYREPNYKKLSLEEILKKEEERYLDYTIEKILIGNQEAIFIQPIAYPLKTIEFIRDDGFIYILRGEIFGGPEGSQSFEEISDSFRFIEKAEKLELSGVEPSEKPNRWVYKNTRYKYQIEFPEEIDIDSRVRYWKGGETLTETTKGIVFILKDEPYKPPFSIIVSEETQLSLREFIRETPGLSPEKGEILKINGREAIKFRYLSNRSLLISRHPIEWLQEPYQEIIFTKNDNNIFVMVVGSGAAQKIINQILSTFRFLE